jgi:hypothetical protein
VTSAHIVILDSVYKYSVFWILATLSKETGYIRILFYSSCIWLMSLFLQTYMLTVCVFVLSTAIVFFCLCHISFRLAAGTDTTPLWSTSCRNASQYCTSCFASTRICVPCCVTLYLYFCLQMPTEGELRWGNSWVTCRRTRVKLQPGNDNIYWYYCL